MIRASQPFAVSFAVALLLLGCMGPSRLVRHQSGAEASLEQLRGKVVIVNFWATWCQPCIDEIPALIAISERYGDRVAFVAVFYEEESTGRPLVERWLKNNPPGLAPYIYYGNDALHWAFPHRELPTTYVLDARGEVVEHLRGSLAPSRARELIERTLARDAASATAR